MVPVAREAEQPSLAAGDRDLEAVEADSGAVGVAAGSAAEEDSGVDGAAAEEAIPIPAAAAKPTRV